jgi:DNA-binding GntR family transcriptional regulator
MLKLIQPISKKNQVVLTIKEAILSGSIAPGAQIVESRIAQQLGTGIPLVREALIELEHQGFVQKTPYKGTTVTELGPKEIRQMFQLRGELEALAVVWAKENATAADIEELRALIAGMEAAASGRDSEKFSEADLAFHRKLWELARNPYLSDALERVVLPLFAFSVMRFRRERNGFVESAAQHAKIVEALPEMSTGYLRDLMKELVGCWKDEMLEPLLSGDGAVEDEGGASGSPRS